MRFALSIEEILQKGLPPKDKSQYFCWNILSAVIEFETHKSSPPAAKLSFRLSIEPK
ncbi:hypothetical protein [Chamaesiphon minutus]|uniref:hypothetical protein n=1 Tax=Chamaesiphon minutus TaxID=1173032 RepID=UPI0002F9D4C4|nr:hypothetical protein [Chamaesiphon minutus]